MCGIVGVVGHPDAVHVVMEGLGRLEYRGYDSAGVAVLTEGAVQTRRAVGKLSNLRGLLAEDAVAGSMCIGHTRWATHGRPTTDNAHPHRSENGRIALVHNGIVENFLELRAELEAEGYVFQSATDTEVVAQLIGHTYTHETNGDLVEAVRSAAARLLGANALLVMAVDRPDELVAVKLGNAGGLVLGVGEQQNYIASDIPAILEHTRKMIFLDNRQMVTLRPGAYTLQTLEGEPVAGAIHAINWDPVSAAKGEYRHFMQKEIFEQAKAITDTLRGRVNFESGSIMLDTLPLSPESVASIDRFVTIACGTSYYSGLVGKFYLEELAGIPTEVDYASEYRYRHSIVDDRTVILSITQSGETADTLAAMDKGAQVGGRLWTIVNVIGSAAMRAAEGHITMNTGPEIGVASTKAFTASLVDQYMMALQLGHARGVLSDEAMREHVEGLSHLPRLVGEVLELDDEIHKLAQRFHHSNEFLFLGRGVNYPTALEGALKLKEISYIHAEGYPAGEMKHGPIALIDETLPVVAIALKDDLYDKMISQIEQVRARGGQVIAIATQGDAFIQSRADHVLYIPPVPRLLSPVVATVPLQLLAYHIAVWAGADVDQPRNLAKSVTVE